MPNKTAEQEDPRREIFKEAWDLIGAGSAYSAIVAAAVYAMGYLVLRYQHNTLGIATDPPLIDERYLFAGARFLINVIIALANIMLVLLVLSVICFLIYHALPESTRTRLASKWNNRKVLNTPPWSRPNRIAIIGIFFSVAFFHLFMTHCFSFLFVLISDQLPMHVLVYRVLWKWGFLTAQSQLYMFWYFSFLVAGTVAGGCLVVMVFMRGGWRRDSSFSTKVLTGLVTGTVFVLIIFLPVNYGTLIAIRDLPRVAYLSKPGDLDCQKREDGESCTKDAWLLWRGKAGEGVTFLVRKMREGKETRSLITLPLKSSPNIEIVKYESILHALFADKPRFSGSKPNSERSNEAKIQ